MAWEDLRVEDLRTIAKHYNTQVKIVGISKMKKPQLIEALKKHLDLDADSLGVKHKTDKKAFNLRDSANTDTMKAKPKPKAEKKPKAVAKKADLPVPPPTPKKAEDKKEAHKPEAPAKKKTNDEYKIGESGSKIIYMTASQLNNPTTTEIFIRMLRSNDAFKSQAADTKLYNKMKKADPEELSYIMRDNMNKVNYFTRQKFFKDFAREATRHKTYTDL